MYLFCLGTGDFPELASSIASLSTVEASLVEYSFQPHFSKESEGNNSVSIYFLTQFEMATLFIKLKVSVIRLNIKLN